MATDAYGNEVDDEIQYQQNQQQPIPAGQQVIAGPTPAPQQAAPAYDTKGAYEGFRNDWLGQGFGNQTNADNLAKTAAKYGYTVKGGDKVYDAQGGFVGDMIGDIGGRSTLQFLRGAEGHATTDKVYGGKSTPKTPPGPTNKPPAGGGGGGGTGGGAGGGYTGNLSGQSGDLFNLLMERAKGSENVDPNDPIIKAQTDAYRSEGVNARRDFLAAQAEAAGPYGNQRSEERRSAEQLGKSVGGFQGQAMQNELSARRAKIEHALDSGAQFLSEQQRMALQNELTRLQLAQQESQFGRNLKQQGSQFDRNLAMQKDQFGRSLGQRAYEYDTSRWDDIFL
jgi:hypothetical protein